MVCPEADVAFEDLQDPFGIEFWPVFKGRDGCRTPMAWEPKANLGFSDRNNSWLPPEQKHQALSAESQDAVESSTLSFVRKFIAFRKQHNALISGKLEWLSEAGDCLIYQRQNDNEKIIVAINFGEETADLTQYESNEVIWGELSNGCINPYQVVVFKIE